MNLHTGIWKLVFTGFASIVAVIIPLHFIYNAYLGYQVTALQVSQFERPTSAFFLPTLTSESPRPDMLNHLSRLSVTIDKTPTVSFTTSPTKIKTAESDFLEASIQEVIHIENGEQTLIKIKFSGKIEGQFYAEVAAFWSKLIYPCSIYGESQNYLFCFGPMLNATNQANIRIFQLEGGSERSDIIFTSDFAVPQLESTPTKTPSLVAPPQPNITATFTAIPTSTYTPSVELTPEPTSTYTPSVELTPEPTNMPKPTHTKRPTHTPRPTKPPK